jgi:hypothetical protein
MARPRIYKPEFVELAYRYALLGATEVELAEAFGVTRNGFQKWLVRYPELREAVVKGRDVADSRVAQSLYHRALGYTHPEEIVKFDREGNELRAQTVKHYAPDVVACIFWLKNRQRDKWRDRQEIEHSQSPYKDMTDEQLAAEIRQLQKES